MNENDLMDKMEYKRDGKIYRPLFVSLINGSYIIAAYQGSLSKFDILIKYRQKKDDKWSRIRTPKHIHWAVDILIKMHSEEEKTKAFLGKLIEIWDNTYPIKTEDERNSILSIEHLLTECQEEFKDYQVLSEKGEYSLNFLILLAKLLMLQEKTNLESAYMFRNLLKALENGGDIFKIVSIATHR